MKIGKKESLYVLLMGGAIGVGFIRTIVFGSYLSPEEMGYFSIALTVASYGALLQLGLMSGLNRELPVTLGRGEEKHSSGLVGETTVAIGSLLLIGLIIYFIVLANITFSDTSVKTAFIWGGFLAFSNLFAQIVVLRLRAEQRIISFSILKLINSFAILFLGILAIYYMTYKGALLTIILVNFLCFIIVSKTVLKPVNYFFFRLKDILYLLRIGLPLMTAGILLNLQLSMDRLFLIKNVSAHEIGIYQIGILPLTLGLVNSGIIGQYVSPKLLFRYGQGKPLKYVFDRSLMVSLIVIGVMLLFWPVVVPLANFVISRWLPEYQDSSSLIFIFYLGAIFTSANITGIVINAANRQVMSLYGAAFMALVCFTGYMLITHYNMTILWYAYLNVTMQILNFFMIIGISYYLVKNQHQVEINSNSINLRDSF